MTVWDLAQRARDDEHAYAAIGVRALQRGNQDKAENFFMAAAESRAEYYDYRGTAEQLHDLWSERATALRLRADEIRRKYRADHGLPTT